MINPRIWELCLAVGSGIHYFIVIFFYLLLKISKPSSVIYANTITRPKILVVHIFLFHVLFIFTCGSIRWHNFVLLFLEIWSLSASFYMCGMLGNFYDIFFLSIYCKLLTVLLSKSNRIYFIECSCVLPFWILTKQKYKNKNNFNNNILILHRTR